MVFSAVFLFSSLRLWAQTPANSLQLSSAAFKANADIPEKYTCDGGDINPPLTIGNVPDHTKSLALTVSDPDAPEGPWTHWIVYNIPPQTVRIMENNNPGTEGLNDFGKYAYRGPCPGDSRVHHYVFHAYALDVVLNINEAPSIGEVEKALKGHVIGESDLVGTYQKHVS